MNSEGYFFWWASRLLAAVCLLLLILTIALDRDEQLLPGLELDPGLTVLAPTDSASKLDLPRPDTRPSAREVAGMRAARRPMRGRQHALKSAKPKNHRKDPGVAPAARSVAASPPGPAFAVTALKALGYVERSDGSVEAIVGDRDHVSIVHEGGTYAERYRVLDITPTLVKVVEDSADAAAQPSILKAHSESENQIASLQGVRSEPPAPAEAQRAPSTPAQSGQLKPAIRPDPPAKSLDNKGQRLPATEAGQYPVGMQADIRRPVDAVAPDTERSEAIPATTRTLKPIGYVEWASGRFEAIVDHQGRVQVLGASERFDRDYFARRVSPSSVEIVEESRQPFTVHPAPGTVRGEEGKPDLDLRVARALSATSLEGKGLVILPGGEPCPAAVGARAPPACGLKQLGYVERNDGQLLAIMADRDEIYLVGEGEVFAHRFRAIRVSRSWVDFVDETVELARRRALPVIATSSELDQSPNGLNTLARAPPPRTGGRALSAAAFGSVDSRSGEVGRANAPRGATRLSEALVNVGATLKAEASSNTKARGGIRPSLQPQSHSPPRAAIDFVHWAFSGQGLIVGDPDRLRSGLDQRIGGGCVGLPAVAGLPMTDNLLPRRAVNSSFGRRARGTYWLSVSGGSLATSRARPPPRARGISAAAE